MNEDLTKDLPPHGVQLILTQLSVIDSRLTSLEDRVDRKLSETRPIWEQVLSRLEAVESRQSGLDEKLSGFDERFNGIDERFNSVDERLNSIDGMLITLDGKIEDLGLDTRAGFKRLERELGQLSSDVIAVRTDQSDLERRMDRLEDKLDSKPAP